MIPDYESIMFPLLKLAGDDREHLIRDAREKLAERFNLSDNDKREFLPSGQQTVFNNRVGWAKTYLVNSGLLSSRKRGYFKITQRGLNVLKENPDELNNKYLERFEEFRHFKNRRKNDNNLKQDKEQDKNKSIQILIDPQENPLHENLRSSQDEIKPLTLSPEEIIEKQYQNIRDNLAEDLLETIKGCSSGFFEKLVIDLLLNMGYGGSRKDAGKAIGKSGDYGIDGVINEDRLGLDVIYIQAKKWENTVSRPEIQKFAGALLGKNAKKGVFITTAHFSKSALDYADNDVKNIRLIDGKELAELMIDYDVGVSKIRQYEIKAIDSDYFNDD